MTITEVQQRIVDECDALKELLVSKNRLYGNSALEPSMVLAQSDVLEQIAVRCDDKLKRIRNMGGLGAVLRSGSPDAEDTVQDLLGYLVLARVAARPTP